VQKFSELMRGNELIVAPVALNPIMARLAEEVLVTIRWQAQRFAVPWAHSTGALRSWEWGSFKERD